MTLPRYFRRNFITTYLKTGSTALVSLVMTPVLVVGLGKEAFGVWVVVTSLSVFRDLLQFGFGVATPKYVAEYSALGDDDRLRASIATSFWILAAMGALALALGLGLAVAFPGLFSLGGDLESPAQILVVLMAIDFAVSMPCNAFVGTLAGLQRYDLLNTTQVALVFAQAAGWAVALALGGGLVALGAVTLALSLVGQLIRYLIARRLVAGLDVSPSRVDRRLVKPFAGFSIRLAVEDDAVVLLNRIDAVVVGLVLGVGAAGIYGVGQRLAIALGQLVQPVAGLFFPHSADLAARRDVAGLRTSFLTGTRLLLAVSAPLALTLGILAGPIIEVWVGAGFGGADSVTVFLAAAVVVWVLIDTGLSMLQGMGKARRPAIIRAGETALNLSLSVLLAHLIGLEGVALATLVAAIAANVFVLLPQMCRQFGLRLRDFARPLIVAHAPALAAGLIVGWLVTRLEPTGVLSLAGAAAAIAGAYVAVLAVTGLDRSERYALLERAPWRSGPYVPPA